jgi:hypothetical protein
MFDAIGLNAEEKLVPHILPLFRPSIWASHRPTMSAQPKNAIAEAMRWTMTFDD